MKRDTIRELVEIAPAMTQDHWDDLGELCRRRECIPAFLGWVLTLAQSQFNTTLNMSTADPAQKEKVDQIKGQVIGYQALVGQACDLMGDLHEEPVEEETEQVQPRQRKMAPAKKTKTTSRRRK